MKYIVFSQAVAAFAYNRLNNVLFALESPTRVNLLGAMGLQIDGTMTDKDEPIFQQVLDMFGGAFSDLPPPAFEPKKPSVERRRKDPYAFTLRGERDRALDNKR